MTRDAESRSVYLVASFRHLYLAAAEPDHVGVVEK